MGNRIECEKPRIFFEFFFFRFKKPKIFLKICFSRKLYFLHHRIFVQIILNQFIKVSACPFAKSWQSVLSMAGDDRPLPDSYFNQRHSQLAAFFNLKPLVNDIDERLHRRVRHMHALALFARRQFAASFALFQTMRTDPSHLVAALPGLLPDRRRAMLKLDEYFPNDLDERERAEATSALIDYLQYKRKEMLKDNNNNNNSSSSSSRPASSSSASSSSTATAGESNAFFLEPLIDGRPVEATRLGILKIIDTTLLKCYLLTNVNLLPFFLRIEPNFVSLEEGERVLKKADKLAELIILYERKEAHERALELLMHNSSNSSNSNQTRDFKPIVDYMKRRESKHIELILKYGKSVIEAEPEWALKLFTNSDLAQLDRLVMLKIERLNERRSRAAAAAATSSSAIAHRTAAARLGRRASAFQLTKAKANTANANNNKTNSTAAANGSKSAARRFVDELIDGEAFDFDDEDEDTLLRKLKAEQVCAFFQARVEPAELGVQFIRLYLQYCIYICGETNVNLNNLLIDTYKMFIENDYRAADERINSLSIRLG